MGMKNDLAFVLEMGMYLYEHQSTYNPNIPLRDLFYIASEYQDLGGWKVPIFVRNSKDSDTEVPGVL